MPERLAHPDQVTEVCVHAAAEKFDVENVCCLFPQLDFPKDGGTVRFAVRPCNAFGRHGKPIHSDWVDLKEEG